MCAALLFRVLFRVGFCDVIEGFLAVRERHHDVVTDFFATLACDRRLVYEPLTVAIDDFKLVVFTDLARDYFFTASLIGEAHHAFVPQDERRERLASAVVFERHEIELVQPRRRIETERRACESAAEHRGKLALGEVARLAHKRHEYAREPFRVLLYRGRQSVLNALQGVGVIQLHIHNVRGRRLLAHSGSPFHSGLCFIVDSRHLYFLLKIYSAYN